MKVISGTKYPYAENYPFVLSIYKLHIFQSKPIMEQNYSKYFIENGKYFKLKQEMIILN